MAVISQAIIMEHYDFEDVRLVHYVKGQSSMAQQRRQSLGHSTCARRRFWGNMLQRAIPDLIIF